MYKLTDRRLEAAKSILEKYREWLRVSHRFEPNQLEKELRDSWNIGYQSLKDIMIDMLKNDRYRYVAAYYMQHQNPMGPVSEFSLPLARLYGTRQLDPLDKDKKREQFWKTAFDSNLEAPFADD